MEIILFPRSIIKQQSGRRAAARLAFLQSEIDKLFQTISAAHRAAADINDREYPAEIVKAVDDLLAHLKTSANCLVFLAGHLDELMGGLKND